MSKWIKTVKTKWKPDPKLFTKSASVIAKAVFDGAKNLQQAMARLTFYENRAGANLSPSHRKNIEEAKKKVRASFTKLEARAAKTQKRHTNAPRNKSPHPRAGSAYWYAYEKGERLQWIKGRNPYRTKGRTPIRYLGRKPVPAIGKGPFHVFIVDVRGRHALVAQLLGPKR
jgi:hypothetical protein